MHIHPPGFLTKRLHLAIFLVILLSFFLSSCVTLNDPESSQDFNSDVVGTLGLGTSVGQTFTSRRALLNGMTIWLSPINKPGSSSDYPSSIPIKAELFHSPSDSVALFSTIFHISSLASSQAITLQLDDLENLPGQDFYIQLTSTSNTVQVHGRGEDAYPHGQVYINQQPHDSDFAFRLSYEYNFEALIQDSYKALKNFLLIFPLVFILILPGWLLLDISGIKNRFDLGEQVGMALGISLVFYPLLFLWSMYTHISWSREGLYFLTFLLVLLLVSRIAYRFHSTTTLNPDITGNTLPARGDLNSSTGYKYGRYSSCLIPISLLLIFLVSLAVRLIMVRDLATPAWVDSVHHALITRLIMTQGSLPTSYAPYLEISPTDYHPGFHTIAAVFTWFSNLDIPGSLLILGQVLNASMVFSVYLMTKAITKSSTAGIIAALLTGLLSPMPAYYTSWGRYTELTGLIILPSAFKLISLLKGDTQPGHYPGIIILGAVISAGLLMVHYRVFTFLILLIIAFIAVYLPGNNRSTAPHVKSILLPLTVMAVLAFLFISPWFVQMIQNTLLPNIAATASSPIPFFQDFAWSYLTAAMGKQILVLAALGLIWGALMKERFSLLLLVWVFLLFLVANLAAFGLPGGGLISNSSVEIMLFIPISILGGYFLSQLVNVWTHAVPSRLAIIPVVIFIFSIALWGFLGSKLLVSILNPVTILSRQADLTANEWISKNIPETDTIVINPFNWGYGIYAGNDGGYWISPLTGRLTVPPPVLYGLGSNTARIKELIHGIISSTDPTLLYSFMQSHRLNYIYTGARGGVISPSKLVDSGLFNLLYYQEGVWILSLKP